jgi:hypothetical protein
MHVEAPRESEIRRAVEQLRDADPGTPAQVEWLARRLSREAFQAVVEKHRLRCESTSVRNEPGLLVHLLKGALKGQLEAAAAARAAAAVEQPLGRIERLKREEPEQYLAQMAQVPGFDLGAYLRQYVADPSERERLARLFDERMAA